MEPQIRPARPDEFDSPDREVAGVAEWIGRSIRDGVAPVEIGMFVRPGNELARVRVKPSGRPGQTVVSGVTPASEFFSDLDGGRWNP